MEDSNLKVMIGATVAMVAVVLILLLLLLIQLYCSLFLRRRRHPTSTTTTTTSAITSAAANTPPHPSDLRPFYAQGVIRAPRSFLFPAAPDNYSGGGDLEVSPYSSPTISTVEQMMKMYNISNPMYDEEGHVSGTRKEKENVGIVNVTPPLTPMKKLPLQCPSVSVTGTDSYAAISSTSSCNSPSW